MTPQEKFDNFKGMIDQIKQLYQMYREELVFIDEAKDKMVAAILRSDI